MLLNDFFFIRQIESNDKVLKASLQINKDHGIFEGHFPEIPIVPGVCMMQMVKEITEQHVSRKLIIRTGENVKFLSIINPMEHSELQADIHHEEGQDGCIKINATLFSGTIIFFKLKATLASA